MRAVLQRVSRASVSVDGVVTGEIGKGILALVGVETGDTTEDAKYIAEKIASTRFFNDADDKMNLSVADVGGSVLVISQFTLHGDCRRGRRPSFVLAARPETAIPLYEFVVNHLRDTAGLGVATGVFGAHMHVDLCNEGPVTLLLDSRKVF
jgi:D-aminoacyl-tRNA deacylase